MKISIAQIQSISGDIKANIARHSQAIQQAIAHQADSIFFPELSITGYEPTLAAKLALNLQDSQLDSFQSYSNQHKITIGIGAPVLSTRGILIAMIIFQPHQARTLYAKQWLHLDEKPYFVAGQEQVILQLQNIKLAPAICYESLQDVHIKNAYHLGAQIYLASVAKSLKGVQKALNYYPKVAAEYAIPIAMVNAIGYCDTFESKGQSAIWSSTGQLLAQLDEQSEGLLIYDTAQQKTISLNL